MSITNQPGLLGAVKTEPLCFMFSAKFQVVQNAKPLMFANYALTNQILCLVNKMA